MRRQATGKGGRRGERAPAEAEPGRLALVRRRGPSLAMILGVHAIRRPSHAVRRAPASRRGDPLKSGLVKRIFWATRRCT